MPEKEFVFDPAWSPEGKTIAYTTLTDNGISLKMLDLNSQIIKTVIPPSNEEDIRSPSFFRNYLLYESDYSGINNIYVVDLESGRRFQVTSKRYGAFFPEVSHDTRKLYFSNYTPKGCEIISAPLAPEAWKVLDEVNVQKFSYFKPIDGPGKPGGLCKSKNAEKRKYNVKGYNPLLHSINFHSLLPSIDTTNEDIFLQLISSDPLLTTQTLLGYRYNYRESVGSISLDMNYSGHFPVISIGGGYGKRAEPQENPLPSRRWKELEGRVGVTFPLNLSRGIHSTYLNFGTFAKHREISDRSLYGYSKDYDYSIESLYHYFFFSRSRQKAPHDIYPSFAQNLLVSLSHTLGNSNYKGSQFDLRSRIFLPGLFDHDSFHLEGTFERQKQSNSYTWDNSFFFPRGYIESDERILDNFYKLAANYTFPIINTNLSIWKVFYLKRINGNLFFDYGLTEDNQKTLIYRSVGMELPLESYLLTNKYIRIRTGLRYSYCIDNDKSRFDFILSIY